MNEDFIIDNLLKPKKKKKVNSNKKGKRKELQVVAALNKRFEEMLSKFPSWAQFSRTVASGARWGQNVVLPQHAKDTFTGDLVCPSGGFKYVIESKGGYNEIDLCSVFNGKCSQLDGFLSQVQKDAERCGRKPLLLWKKDRKPMLSVVKYEDVKNYEFKIYMKYNDWIILEFDDFFKLPDNFFFKNA